LSVFSALNQDWHNGLPRTAVRSRRNAFTFYLDARGRLCLPKIQGSTVWSDETTLPPACPRDGHPTGRCRGAEWAEHHENPSSPDVRSGCSTGGFAPVLVAGDVRAVTPCSPAEVLSRGHGAHGTRNRKARVPRRRIIFGSLEVYLLCCYFIFLIFYMNIFNYFSKILCLSCTPSTTIFI
jgi:hypothetical protein